MDGPIAGSLDESDTRVTPPVSVQVDTSSTTPNPSPRMNGRRGRPASPPAPALFSLIGWRLIFRFRPISQLISQQETISRQIAGIQWRTQTQVPAVAGAQADIPVTVGTTNDIAVPGGTTGRYSSHSQQTGGSSGSKEEADGSGPATAGMPGDIPVLVGPSTDIPPPTEQELV
ncbi:hypothetical protein PGTUg99_004762 [Puccinia graminis f. sp. tritici]|uniref:Uncharacterized protein n=1 Tax=Puccinia graminis f. sp. tritici TaxID=56615 RepID=A0A5B0RAJ9_PUCGR|nr:hypothetical protein PGTUg99_004762 [Puccinia graminis f. sp. tritici]